jgi:hypothetical protein
MLTAMWRSSGHWAAVVQASRITHSPIGTMKPISSASGMKEAGEIIPLVGWFQRIRASNPLISLLARLTTGW